MFENGDIGASFDPLTYARGLAYARSGRVLKVEAVSGTTVEATVQGSARTPYSVTSEYLTGRSDLRFATYCDCPVARQCKHGAAALIALHDISQGNDGAPGGDADPDAAVVSGWLDRLVAFSAPPAEQLKSEELRYLLDFAGKALRFKLTARAVSVLGNGERSVGRAADLASLNYTTYSYVKPIDRTIGRLAVAAGVVDQYSYSNRGGLISPRLLAVLLDEVVHTERAHWASPKAPVLTRRDLSEQRLIWFCDAEGRQRPCVEGEPALRLLPSNPTWYADPASGACGTIDLGIAAEAAAVILGAPPLTPRSARSVQTAWKRAFGAGGPPAPQPDVETVVLERDPTPVLRLRGFAPSPPAAVAEVAFAYGANTVPLSSDVPREFESKEDGRVTIWPRQQEFEAAARAKLDEYGLHLLGWPELQYVANHNAALRFPGAGEQRWVRFLGNGVPALRASGWRIEIEPSFPYELIEAGEWDAQIEASANHWFEFDLGITVGSERVSLLPIVIDALRDLGIRSHQDLAALDADTTVYGRVREGAFVALPAKRIAPLLATLVELFDTPLTREGRLALTPAHISSIAQLERATPVRWAAGTRLRDLVRALGDEESLAPAALPSTFKGTLRHYQERGVAWLQLLARNDFGGVLADDMGLGKTVELLAHVAIEKAARRLKKPVLIVSPTSVSPNWRSEIARFVPHLRVLALTGPERFERFSEIPSHDIVLTTYALLQRDIDLLAAQEWQIAVLDEAQAIKNPRSKGAQAASRLRAGQRLALTGTPMENHLDELWSVFDFAVPGLLGERSAFTRSFRTPIEKRGDTEMRRVLAARLRPFLMRRTKERVARELPAKSEIVNRIELDGAQRDLYETIRIAMHERVRDALRLRGLARSRIVVLDALLKLRQVCCDPRLLKMSAAQAVRESAKLEALLEMVPELIDEGRRILLFSQFTSMLDLMKPALREREIEFVELRGETRDRVTPVARFQEGEVPLFLISLKAGGTGLNLTAADTVIHYDPWWNPAVERQATDRAHRIGQHKPVFVYKLIAAGTVEERIVELQQRKAELAAGIFDESALTTLDTADIERLFSPLTSNR
ncbi:MAG TPA: DEAD/DEAH box helicase [Candidatus Cybelea sp.]|nr:DEAD/DEAH box helicase [Candidatus Cybelea sp.]